MEAGTSTAADEEGNDKRDVNADEGVEKINGNVSLVLGKWIGGRHDHYKKLMKRIHKMIAVINLIATNERDRAEQKTKKNVGV